jgi:hypothetical protein
MKDSSEIGVVMIKSFPNLYFGVKEGVDVLLGTEVRKFVEMCGPLAVNVKPVSFTEIMEMVNDISVGKWSFGGRRKSSF